MPDTSDIELFKQKVDLTTILKYSNFEERITQVDEMTVIALRFSRDQQPAAREYLLKHGTILFNLLGILLQEKSDNHKECSINDDTSNIRVQDCIQNEETFKVTASLRNVRDVPKCEIRNTQSVPRVTRCIDSMLNDEEPKSCLKTPNKEIFMKGVNLDNRAVSDINTNSSQVETLTQKKCDVSKHIVESEILDLLKAVPHLSHCVPTEQNNVRILIGDDQDNLENEEGNYLLLTMELADGTKHNVKVTGYTTDAGQADKMKHDVVVTPTLPEAESSTVTGNRPEDTPRDRPNNIEDTPRDRPNNIEDTPRDRPNNIEDTPRDRPNNIEEDRSEAGNRPEDTPRDRPNNIEEDRSEAGSVDECMDDEETELADISTEEQLSKRDVVSESEQCSNNLRRSLRKGQRSKVKIEGVKQGRGRPRNNNIPRPVTDSTGQSVYICPICNSSVKTYHALIVHNRTHTGLRPFQCSYCNKSFTTKGNMKSHEKITHSEDKPWKCEYCNKTFKERKVLLVHERTHTGEKPFRCDVCNRGFTQKAVLLEHMLTHSDKKPHLCDVCGQGFRGASSLRAHHKRHIDVREFQCETCDKAFIRRNDLTRHRLTHSGQKPHQCDVCLKAFTRSSYLREHMNIHSGAKPFKCPYCTVAFSDSMSLQRHRKKHRLQDNGGLQTTSRAVSTGAKYDMISHSSETQGSVTTIHISDSSDQIILNGDEKSVQVLIDENTSIEDFQRLQTLLVSAAGGSELVKYSQDNSGQYYQVVCVNPDTQEVVGQVEGHEVIIEGHVSDSTEFNLLTASSSDHNVIQTD